MCAHTHLFINLYVSRLWTHVRIYLCMLSFAGFWKGEIISSYACIRLSLCVCVCVRKCVCVCLVPNQRTSQWGAVFNRTKTANLHQILFWRSGIGFKRIISVVLFLLVFLFCFFFFSILWDFISFFFFRSINGNRSWPHIISVPDFSTPTFFPIKKSIVHC